MLWNTHVIRVALDMKRRTCHSHTCYQSINPSKLQPMGTVRHELLNYLAQALKFIGGLTLITV